MKLQWHEIRARAALFSEQHKHDHYEKGQTQTFYNEFFGVFGVDRKQVAVYEQRVKNLPGDRRGFIDLFMPGTLIVEQKSAGLDLRVANDQALDYYQGLPESIRPRYILTCDFQRFELLDLETRGEWRFPLADLKKHVEAFAFIVGVPTRQFRNQKPANPKASELLGKLHENLAGRGYTGHKLQLLLVRLLFVLFADDTGIWPKDQFLVFLERRTGADGRDLGRWLSELFDVLNTPDGQNGTENLRQAGLDADLAAFPYINGKLFAEPIGTAVFDNVTRDILLDASVFDWGGVSPAIFGSLFESVIDTVTRRKQGAHYTPEGAILKVLGPLFLDDLWAEFEGLAARKDGGRERTLGAFHEKLAALTFFDPACGAGNFLVVAYRELRELENAVLKELYPVGRLPFGPEEISKLNVSQFYGIEIDEFPSQIAQVALWMTDHIANTNLGDLYGRPFARIPLVAAPNIRHGDALEIDWDGVLPAERCSYVFGNPPFVGAKYQSEAQRAQVRQIARLGGSGGTLDYVAAWFVKAGDYAAGGKEVSPAPDQVPGDGLLEDTASSRRPGLDPGPGFFSPRIAFVATNSICQGEQVAQLWPILFHRHALEIAFAHRTFVWPGRAAVHCLIVGLAVRGVEPKEKRLFSYRADGKGEAVETPHEWLTAYLFSVGEGLRHGVVESVSHPLGSDKPLIIGSKPIDGGHYIFDASSRAAVLAKDPAAARFMRPYIGAQEFINGGDRWIFALHDAAPADMRASPTVGERVRRVRTVREASGSAPTRALAATPLLYHVNVLPTAPFLVIPEVSSERRAYVPIGWLQPPTIPSNLVRVLENATLYDFAILNSATHMAWLRHIGGRLKSDYRYSIGLVYNTFPWPDASPAQRAKIEALAQDVLDARALPKNATSTLADLYDPDRMPPELHRAHRALDMAVDKLYRAKGFADDRERVEHLFALYEALVMPTAAAPAANRRTVRRVRRARNVGTEN